MRIKLGKNLKKSLKTPKTEVNITTGNNIKSHKEILIQNNQFCNQLRNYFNNEFNDSTFKYEDSSSSILNIVDDNVRLYLRIQVISNQNLKRTIEIATIGFKNERSGHGTALLKYILGIAESFNIKEIKILSTNDKSKAFALKNGFELLNCNDYIARL